MGESKGLYTGNISIHCSRLDDACMQQLVLLMLD